MDDIKEKIKQALRHIWTNKYRLFLCLLTLCCLFGLIHYFKSADSATASISFNYSEAALGMNPNKTRFNAYEIVSDEVMERAIRRVVPPFIQGNPDYFPQRNSSLQMQKYSSD